MRIGAVIVVGVLAATGCERLLALEPVSHLDAAGDAAERPDAPAIDGAGSDPCTAPFAYYQFENPSALTDSSGNQYDGTVLPPAPGQAMGHQGFAYEFDGSDNVVELGRPVYQVTPLTVSIWFAPKQSDLSQCFINQLTLDAQGNYDDAWQLCLDSGALLLYGPTVYEIGAVTAGAWHHVVLELDGSHALAWLDGSGGSVAFQLNYTNANKITLGADHDATFDAYYAGVLDELKFFDCAVPADQLEGL